MRTANGFEGENTEDFENWMFVYRPLPYCTIVSRNVNKRAMTLVRIYLTRCMCEIKYNKQALKRMRKYSVPLDKVLFGKLMYAY